MATREEQISKEIKVEFCRRVIPSDLTIYLNCLTKRDIEVIRATETQKGPSSAAEILLQRLERRQDWLRELLKALLNPDIGLVDFGEKIEKKYEQLAVTIDVGPAYTYCTGGNCGEDDVSVIVEEEEIVICCREEWISKEIKIEFCERVIPSHLMRYLNCLTKRDIEVTRATETQKGPSSAAEILLQRLERRQDWLRELLKALLNPDIGLVDFGEKIEKKYVEQLAVTIVCPGCEYCTGGNCEEHETSHKSIVKDKENEGSASCPPAEKDSIENDRLRENFKLQVYHKLLKFIRHPDEFPEMMAHAKSICTEFDEVLHKCIVLMFRMETVDTLEAFWNLYQTGGLLTLLSHDILTPQRRQQVITDAKNDGIELEESDFCLQITIKESDYLFVKDVLTRKNVPLMPRNTVESVILHGRHMRDYTQTQVKRNQKLAFFRRVLPLKLQMSFDDPFVQGAIPDFLIGIAKMDAVNLLYYFYQRIVEILRLQFPEPEKEELSHIAYIMSTCKDYKCILKHQGDNVEFESGDIHVCVSKEYWKTCSKYFYISSDKVSFVSELVLTFLAFEYIDKTIIDNNEKQMIRLSNLKFFPLISGALYGWDCDKITCLVESLSHQAIVEHLYYKWLYTGKTTDVPIRCLPSLNVDLTSESKWCLDDPFKRGRQLQLWIFAPVGSYLADNPNPQLESTEPLKDKDVQPVVLHRDYENDTNLLLVCFREHGTMSKRLYLPKSTEDAFSFMLCIANVINLLGSGEITLDIATNQDVTGKVTNFFIVQYRIVQRPGEVYMPEIIRTEDVWNSYVKRERVSDISLKLDVSSYELRERDVSILANSFTSGLEVTELNLTGTGIKPEQITHLFNAAITANITNLIMNDNKLSFSDQRHGIGLRNLVSLELLEMRNCRLGDKGMEALKKDIFHLQKLRAIDFSKNDFTADGIRLFCNSLLNSNGIRALRIHENNIGPNGGLILSIFLERLEFLEIINVCYCGLKDVGIVALAKVLQSKAMKKMNLRCNKVTMKGSVQLFQSLENSKRLNHFEFGENEVGILHKQTGYSAMPVSFDQPKDVSEAFDKMLLSCKESMEHLGLWNCGIGNTSILDDPTVFSKLSELTELILQANELEDNHAATLGECLPSLKNLQSLMLRSNNIGPTGARKLTNGIGGCPSLRSIFLDRNKISDFEVLTEIVEVATKSLGKLQDLDISYNFDMLEVARDDLKYRRLLESAVNSLPNSLVKEGDMQTRIESTSATIVI